MGYKCVRQSNTVAGSQDVKQHSRREKSQRPTTTRWVNMTVGFVSLAIPLGIYFLLNSSDFLLLAFVLMRNWCLPALAGTLASCRITPWPILCFLPSSNPLPYTYTIHDLGPLRNSKVYSKFSKIRQ